MHRKKKSHTPSAIVVINGIGECSINDHNLQYRLSPPDQLVKSIYSLYAMPIDCFVGVLMRHCHPGRIRGMVYRYSLFLVQRYRLCLLRKAARQRLK
jgi:hypothetical protein